MQRRQFMKSLLGSALLYRHPLLAQTPDPDVKRVLVMFKCHFDAGFVDTQAAIVRRYFQNFFPQAITLAAHLRQSGSQRYVWTTGSWLLYEYLEAATPEDRTRMEKAIAQGDIAWHALPFSWQTEMLDPSMIAGAIGLSQTLDRRFGRNTAGAKMTDVPGHTRGIIAPLASQGVTFLEIGVNDASTPAQVPPIFLWKAPGGETLAVMYHHSYGGVTRVPNSDLVLATVVRDDNSGPHTLEEVHATYADLSARFPNAQIVPTSLGEMANALRPYHSGLPVVTQEIGDTWIHGVASDPLKVARYREVSRLRQAWLAQHKFAVGDATDVALLRHHLLEIEHTWGTDTKTWLDFDHYTPADLATMLDTKNYKVVQFSWQEKRDDLFAGINALPAPLQQEAQAAVKNLAPIKPKLSQSKPMTGELETPHLTLAFDDQTGALRRLRNKKSGQEWAAADHPLALFSYQTLSQADYDVFFKSYVISTADWAYKDFGKPNIQRYGAKSQELLPSATTLHWEEGPQGHRVLAQLAINDPLAPKAIYLEYLIPTDEPVIDLNVYWFEKPATRLPEAHWLSFRPIAPDSSAWKLEKSGESVSPQDVVQSGNRHMHALSRGFGYKDFFVETIDAPVVAVGVKSPLPFSNAPADPSAGIHCNLFNNAWGTNYIMWYGEDMRFRFRLHA
jgi:hypothetical protein